MHPGFTKKLRKNLGNKNCEFSPDHIRDIVTCFLAMDIKEPEQDENKNNAGIAAKVFENSDFGYYKVAIERSDRRKTQISPDRTTPLRFDRTLAEPMQWIYEQFGDAVYAPGTLAENEKQILAFREDSGIALNGRNRKKLFSLYTWTRQLKLVAAAQKLMNEVGPDEWNDFNRFEKAVDSALKEQKIRLSSATEKRPSSMPCPGMMKPLTGSLKEGQTKMTSIEIDNNIKKLILLVCPKSVPVYVPVEPESYAQISFCFPAVQEKINREGGEQIIGWQIWKTNFLVEAEFHAIWKSPSSKLVDITPKHYPIDKILFLPELSKDYAGEQVDNIRLNISNNPLVDDLIEVSKMIYRQLNKGDLAQKHGELRLYGRDAEIIKALSQIKQGILWMLNNGKSKNSKCFCGRELKYKNCHGKDIERASKRL
jgi:hypothetical protein